MRKRIFLTLGAGLLIVLPIMLNRANPIIEGFFNELVFDAAGWKLEMHALGTPTLDGWYLTSRSGQAYFKNGIQLTGVYRVITPESLLTPLTINRLGDSLTIHSPQTARALMVFGPGGFLPAPRNGQSMCLRESGSQFYYLDNTPTLGQPNHALNAMGIVRGRIVDTLGLPISGVQISWGDPPFVYSDTDGNYSLTEYARRLSLSFAHPNFATRYLAVQVWPESTIVVGVTMSRLLSVGEKGLIVVPSFELKVNYPNPFNPKTSFEFSVPSGRDLAGGGKVPSSKLVTLRVYDVSGREVATLVNEVKQPGTYTAQWDASNVASGVYLYRLQAGSYAETRKMLVIR